MELYARGVAKWVFGNSFVEQSGLSNSSVVHINLFDYIMAEVSPRHITDYLRLNKRIFLSFLSLEAFAIFSLIYVY